MQAGDNHYLKSVNFQLNTKPAGDLKSNFNKILPIAGQTLADQLNEADNLQSYPNPPDLPDVHIIGLSLLQKALSIDSEHWFWSRHQSDYTEEFPDITFVKDIM